MGETKSEYHQIPKPKFNIVPRAYIGRYTTANRKMKYGISTPDCIINSALFIMHYTILTLKQAARLSLNTVTRKP